VSPLTYRQSGTVIAHHAGALRTLLGLLLVVAAIGGGALMALEMLGKVPDELSAFRTREEPPGIGEALFGLLIMAGMISGGLELARSPRRTIIDGRRREVIEVRGVLASPRTVRSPLPAGAEVRLEVREHSKSDSYAVVLALPDRSCELVELGIEEQARGEAIRLARFLELSFRDRVSDAVYPVGKVGEPIAAGAVEVATQSWPPAPVGARSRLTSSGDRLPIRLIVPIPKEEWTVVVAIGLSGALVVAASAHSSLLGDGPNPLPLAARLAWSTTLALSLVALATLVTLIKRARYDQIDVDSREVRASTKGLFFKKVHAQIPMREIFDVRIDGSALSVLAPDRVARWGVGLSAEELEWHRQLILRAIAVHDPTRMSLRRP
jgi:hypothetical protein